MLASVSVAVGQSAAAQAHLIVHSWFNYRVNQAAAARLKGRLVSGEDNGASELFGASGTLNSTLLCVHTYWVRPEGRIDSRVICSWGQVRRDARIGKHRLRLSYVNELFKYYISIA